VTTTTVGARVGISSSYNPNRLFLLSVMSLIAAAWVFSLRAAIMTDIGGAFSLTSAQVGTIAGSAFLGFAISIFIGSPLCDYLGMGRLLALAAVFHVAGVLLTVFSPHLVSSLPAVPLLWGAQFIVGLAHGLVEAVINPLVATIYPDNKTHKLNVLHAWWPGGLAMGGLLAVAAQAMNLNWQVKFGLVLIPTAIYAAMLIGQKFPPTERVASGISNQEMLSDVLQPAFIVLLCCMLLTASLELGPGQWVDAVLTKTVGFPGILVLVYVSILMFVFRFFAGALAHRFSPIGLMFISSILAGLGLFALSLANNPVLGILAATVWGCGVCFMWPTMLGIASERFPRSGALGLGLMGTVGNVAIYFGLPIIGGIYDNATAAALPAGSDLKTMIGQAATNPAIQAQLDQARTIGAPMAFRYVGLLSIILLIAFGIWWMMDKKAGGYKAIQLTQADPGDFSTEAVMDTDVAAAKS
jgi:MFS family permease